MNKSDTFLVKLEELCNKGTIVDVICITEHFMESGNEDLMFIPNFYLAAYYSRNTKRGGTCIFVRTGLQYCILTEVAKQSISGLFECCAIELIPYNIVIISIYRVPKHNYILFYEKLDNILKKLCSSTNKNIILAGDFNIDIIKRNKITLELEYFLLQYNLKLALYKPTRLSSNTCIDNFAHSYQRGCNAEIIDLALSDHTAQILKVPIKKTCKLQFWKCKKRDYSDDNLLKFKNHLSCLSFGGVYNAQDANVSFETFMEDFFITI